MGSDPKKYEFNDDRDFIIFLSLLIEITYKYLRIYDNHFHELEEFTRSNTGEELFKLISSENFDLIKFRFNKKYEKKPKINKINYWKYKSLEYQLLTSRNLLLNAFADRTSNGVSYWRFRKEFQKRKSDDENCLKLTEFDENIRSIFNDLSSSRNYEHHLTDAKFIEWRKYREKQLSLSPIKFRWPSENIQIGLSDFVDLRYLLSTYLASKELQNCFKQLLQYMKKDYSKLIGTTMRIEVENVDILAFEDSEISINGIKRHNGKLH
nr:hypothetical protein [Oscillibacter sp.]